MTNTIGSLSSGHAATEAAGAPAKPPPEAPAPQAGAASSSAAPSGAAPSSAAPSAVRSGAVRSGEAVTLSATSQATAQLLDAARAADGVDEARVAQLRGAVQSGSYDVAPEDVAKAIAGAGIGQPPQGASGHGKS